MIKSIARIRQRWPTAQDFRTERCPVSDGCGEGTIYTFIIPEDTRRFYRGSYLNEQCVKWCDGCGRFVQRDYRRVKNEGE